MSAKASASRVGAYSNMTNAVTGKLGWSYGFEPSIAITTGRVSKLGVDIRSFREPLHKSVKEVMTKSILQNFEEAGRPPWPDLAESTWESRTRRGWTGGLPLSLTGKLGRGASRINIWTFSTTSATIRDLPGDIWYGKVHQAGAGSGARSTTSRRTVTKGKGGILKWSGGRDQDKGSGYVNIPQRQFLLIQPEDHKAIMEIFEKWLDERVRRAMGRSRI